MYICKAALWETFADKSGNPLKRGMDMCDLKAFVLYRLLLTAAIVMLAVFADADSAFAGEKNSLLLSEADNGESAGEGPGEVKADTGESTGTGSGEVKEDTGESTGVSPGAVEKPEKNKVKKIKPVKEVKLTRYATHSIKISWEKCKKAKCYRVYYSKHKNRGYRLAGVTKDTHFLATKLKNDTRYYFYVKSCTKVKRTTPADSRPSKRLSMKTRTYHRKTIFAGDSITEGISLYGRTFPNMHIGGVKKTVAYRGLNTVTFHTNGVFQGKTGLERIIEEKPYRVYMMLGINEIYYRNASDMIPEYRELLKTIKKACPNTDIVLCAVSPVSYAQKASRPGFGQIPEYNKKLKGLAKDLELRYFDYTGFLKDSYGNLKQEYATGDGYHWQAAAYEKFASVVEKYDKSLDR